MATAAASDATRTLAADPPAARDKEKDRQPREASIQAVLATLLADAQADDAILQRQPGAQGPPQGQSAFDYDISFDEVDDRITEFQEDSLVKEAFSKGVNLREYAAQIEADLGLVQDAHVLDYLREIHDMIHLHNQVQECDALLENMENLLRGHQEHLGQINAEISVLQEQSRSMTVRLRNRHICEGEINEFFLQHLAELNKMMAFVKSKQEKKIRAFKDVGPELERLRLRAAEKIRDFLLKKIESLKAPNTNIAIIQQSVFLKYKELFWFLMERYSDVGLEIHANYVVTVANYFFASFEKYIKSIGRFQMVIADKLDLIGCEEGAKRGLFSGRLTLKDKTNVFTLGERVHVLTNPEPEIILPHIAEDKNMKYSYEAIFKSITRLLLDNASSEYIFTTEFFARTKTRHPIEVPGVVFTEVFDQTLKFIQATIKSQIENTFDAVGILICIRLNSQNIRIMQKRRIPCLENFLNIVNILLWPKFQAIIDLHIDSLKKATVSRLLPTKDVHPHYIMRRYAEFSASILTLNQGYDDALLVNSLSRLRGEVLILLNKMAGEFPNRKLRSVFLINNIDLVVSTLSEYIAQSFDHERQFFDTLLVERTTEFVEEELQQYIGLMISFVDQHELTDNLSQVDADSFERIANDFNNSWKTSINAMNNSITQAFPNFQNGARILHTAMTQFLVYYRRFLACFERRFNGKRARVQPVGIQSLMFEIKKFK
ncbi:Vacuolar protein sorting-associated protein 52 [Polyrhizophydium stewartii]|uniref:Vacuolar protein sorting-associated protein 52 n=1 Tax=Polyrhizophydium stewartii TaxID=2732419 RepID=A0ABR4N4D1_9FUNG